MRFNYTTILVPIFILLASAVAFGVHYNMLSYNPHGFGFSITAAHADDGGMGFGGGDAGDTGSSGGMGNDASGTGGDVGFGGGDAGDNGGGIGFGGGDAGDSGDVGFGGGDAGDTSNDNPGGNDNNPPPAPSPTCAFAASAYSVPQGTPLYLAWQSTNATSITIDNGVGAVSPAAIGNVVIKPNTTTTYSMTASGTGGSAVCHVTVTVVPPAPPTGLVGSCVGTTAKISWTGSSADTAYNVRINDTVDGWQDNVSCSSQSGNDICLDNYTSTSKTFTGKPGHTYAFWVHGVNASGAVSAPVSGANFSCPGVPVTPPPTCVLSASPTAIATGGSSQLSWTSTNAASASLDNGIGAVAASNSSVTVHPTATTKYNLTVHGPGGSVVCSTTVTVTPNPPPSKPTCTLAANPTSINAGDASTLTWTTSNATSFTIDHSVGSVTPVPAGSKSVSPSVTTTYTGTATGAGGTVTCAAAITVTPKPPGAPSCTLSASPTAVNSGDHTTLTWTTDNADTFTIDQGVGSVTPANAGSVSSKAITSNTTFTGTAVSPTGVVATCTAAVTVNTGGGGGGGPSCTMTASPSSYTRGGRATITWGGSEIANVDIDNGIATATTSSGSVVVAPANLGTYTYTGTFHATNGQTLTCKASFTVTGGSGGGGGCTSNCGGGGGGGTPSSVITLSALPHATTQPLTYLYLSQIPYTGLDLGTFGTILYWVGLIGWSIALAYLVLFGVLPYAKRKLQAFGEQVASTLNAPAVPAMAYEGAQPHPAPVHRPVMRSEAEQDDTTDRYSPYDGFKSFAREEVLSVEDIVKGLSRASAPAQRVVAPAAAPEPAAPVEQAYIPENIPTAALVQSVHTEAAVPATVRGMVSAILERDKEAVFAALRMHVRGGGEPEALLTPALCMIDDVYRSRIDGTPCDENVSRLAARLDTPTLEKLVASLTTAIDASYATSVTGAKLALTRALAALGA